MDFEKTIEKLTDGAVTVLAIMPETTINESRRFILAVDYDAIEFMDADEAVTQLQSALTVLAAMQTDLTRQFDVSNSVRTLVAEGSLIEVRSEEDGVYRYIVPQEVDTDAEEGETDV